MRKVPTFGGTPMFTWMPDSRHIVVSTKSTQDSPVHLLLADTKSDDVSPITAGSGNEITPAVSPDWTEDRVYGRELRLRRRVGFYR